MTASGNFAGDPMKAIQVHAPGGPDVLVQVDLPLPKPAPGQVRVRASAIGVGGPDVLIRNGTYKWMPPLPAIPGNEMAGMIDAVGDSVSPDRLGQRVFVSARELSQRGGCYAEAICVPAEAPFLLPDTVGFEQAVCLGNFQLAAAMLDFADPARRATSILLPGVAGGVASALAQVARLRGMRCIGTASTPQKKDAAIANGVDVVLGPSPDDLPAQVMQATDGKGVDLAFDHVGADLLIACIRSLAPLGTAVSYNIAGGPPSQDVFNELRKRLGDSLGVRCFSIHTFDATPSLRRGWMEQAIEMMAERRIQVPYITSMPLSQVRQAHELLDTGKTLGKIILKP